MGPPKQMDPWGQVEDLDGTALYNVLQLAPKAKTDEIKRAYRELARQHHPDKGGDPRAFAAVQHAYEVLSDPRRRQVYDTWAKELEFRYVRPTAPGAGLGGEDVLLDEFEALGLRCDPATQLVVTCEVCRRPATKQCWTCGMQICEFCTLKRHWRDGVPLHWPLVNSAHMAERLAMRDLEKKRIDDARRLELEDPNHRSQRELNDVRSFKEAAAAVLALGPERRQITYDLAIARFYMWAQTDATVFIACRVPTGYGDRELVVECSGGGLLVQAEGSPALIDRRLAGTVDRSRPIETFRTEDNRVCAVALPKGELGAAWTSLFSGDPDGVRCLRPPYDLYESDEDAVVQIELPFWIDPEDVTVDMGPAELVVSVRGQLSLRRRYWRNAEEEARRRDYAVVEPEQSTWGLEEDTNAAGERCKVLTITLVRPEPTEEEIQWKKGRRQDNREAKRPGSMHDKGFRFFADDEDEYGLEGLLEALCFAEAGAAFVPARPWVRGEESRWARSEMELPQDARQVLRKLRELGSGKGGDGGGGGIGGAAGRT